MSSTVQTARDPVRAAEAKADAAEAAADRARKAAEAVVREHGPGAWARDAAEIADELELEARELRELAELERADVEDALEEAEAWQ